MTTTPDSLRRLAETAALRALSAQDRNPCSPTLGCFDRRYWAWKLVDYPEATFQRHVYPLALLYRDPQSRLYQRADVFDAIADGLRFAISIQHRNGSFDQAFPFEQSWGATAFLLQPLLEAFVLTGSALGRDAGRIRDGLVRAGLFLSGETEQHGRITNHLAGGAFSLHVAAGILDRRDFADSAAVLVDGILATQSSEGWFPEYGGADPGYQTLCLYYLAEISRIAPTPALIAALDRAIEFLQWFVHPDGTFGGVYGSRRTRVAYLAGFALLAERSPLAGAIAQALGTAAVDGLSISVDAIDEGNLAPVFTSVARATMCPWTTGVEIALPRDRPHASADFREAGLYVRSTSEYFAVFGAANGGTLTVFDRASRALVHDDGGYAGQLEDGTFVTSQVTEPRAVKVSGDRLSIDVPLRGMSFTMPSPAVFLVFRLLNLTVMRSIAIGNLMKRLIVQRLMGPRRAVGLQLHRQVTFGDRIAVEDRIVNPGAVRLRWLRSGRPFNSIHMASAGYFEGAALRSAVTGGSDVDVQRLARDRAVVSTRDVA